MSLSLENYKISSLNVINKKTPSGEKKVNFHYNYRAVKQDDHRAICECTGSLSFADEENIQEKNFFIEIKIIGIFSTDDIGEDLDKLANDCGHELMPFLRAHIASAMASIGMSPIVIPSKTF